MRRFLITIATLSSLGVAVSAYGLWQHYAPLGASFCNVSETFSCDIVNKSAYSEIGGIPVALVGIMGYAVLGLVAIALIRVMYTRDADSAAARMRRSGMRALLALAFLGLAFQAVFTVIEFWWIGAYCPICIASQVIVLAIAVVVAATHRSVRRGGWPSTMLSTPDRMYQSTFGTLTCPQCGAQQRATIPQDRCEQAYVCSTCGKTIAAAPGTCCVFCAYGDRKCPKAT